MSAVQEGGPPCDTKRCDMNIDFAELARVVQHTRNVLQYLDVYMIETHGQNEEWQEILNSY